MQDNPTLPTPGQLKLIRFVHELTDRLGRAPTEREINDALGLSQHGARESLLELEKKGYATFSATARRGDLRVVKAAKGKTLEPLTERQQEVLGFIAALTKRLGRVPGVRELNAELGLSHSGARSTIMELERKGRIAFDEAARRGPVKLTKEGKRWLKWPP